MLMCRRLIKEKLHSIAQRFISSDNYTPCLDYEYLCDPKNILLIRDNISLRKGVGDIDAVVQLNESLKKANLSEKREIQAQLLQEALKIPNTSDPRLKAFGTEPKVVSTSGADPNFKFKPAKFESLSSKLNICRTADIANYTGSRSYFLLDQLAELEQALVQLSIDGLLKRGFELISVPDIVPRNVVESCGMNTTGARTQVYSLDEIHGTDLCLSGTAEIGISQYLQNKNFKIEELPLRLAAVSRCYRAETSKISEEKGIYRVHQFTKVEMYGVSTPEGSESLLEEFRQTQETNFSHLDLKLRTLDMPLHELGPQAYRKYDIEAWMFGKKMWGELSSASNCTDYQSRRLNIKYNGDQFVHTVNGTACAVPRLIIALMETHQNANGTVTLPKILHSYLGYDTIKKSRVAAMKKLKI